MRFATTSTNPDTVFTIFVGGCGLLFEVASHNGTGCQTVFMYQGADNFILALGDGASNYTLEISPGDCP